MKRSFLIGGIVAGVAVAVVAFVALIAVVMMFAPDRYTVTTRRDGSTIRTERSTGKTEILTRDAAGRDVWSPVVAQSAQTIAEAEAAAAAHAETMRQIHAERAAEERARCAQIERDAEAYRQRWGTYPASYLYQVCPPSAR